VHKANGGHGPALRSGLDAACGQYVLLIDSDRQISLDDFAEHWRTVQGHDGLFGIRSQRHDPVARLILTRIVRLSLRILFGVSIWDANVPYKIVRLESWKRASPLIPPDTLAPSLFLAVVMARSGASIVKTPITHRIRETGTVTLRYGKLFKFCSRAFRQLLTLRARLNQGGNMTRQSAAAPP
jgi:glycosyltransferase involved in cell wall biosynthesis